MVGVFEPSDLLSSSARLAEIEGIRLIISNAGTHQWTCVRTFLWGDACVGSDVSLSFYSSDMRVMEGDNRTVVGKAFLSRKVSCKACKLDTYPRTFKLLQTNKQTNKQTKNQISNPHSLLRLYWNSDFTNFYSQFCGCRSKLNIQKC